MSSSKILYLGLIEEAPVQKMKLAGVRRYTDARRWEVVPIPKSDCVPGKIRSLLEKLRPIGCIADSPYAVGFPPSLFGRVPVVWLDVSPDMRGGLGVGPAVSFDNEAVAQVALRELAAIQPESFAAVEFWRSCPWSKLRAAAFCSLAAKTGRPCEVFEARERETTAKRAARLAAWLKRLPLPCGIFAVNDGAASQVRAACRAAYLNVPRDIAIIGVDNDPAICESEAPSLSSIQIDFERAGYVAARMLGTMLGQATRDKRQAATARASAPASRVSPEKPAPVAVDSIKPLLAVRRKSTSGRGRREPRILKAVEMIRAEACGGLTAARLAARFDCSRRLFNMRFREATGHSVLDEILHVRLERAFTLLAETDTAIGAIPHLCGFRTNRALDFLFHSRFNMSMSEWRRKNARR